MADPFSIIGLVGSSLGGIIKAKEWVDGIRRAPQSIKALSVELRALESLLRELGTLLNGFNAPTRDQAGQLARSAIRNCECMLREIDVLLRPFVTADPDTGVTVWKRFAFNYKESDIAQLRREMESCKATLNMAVACANLLATQNIDRRMKRMQRHFGIASSSVAGSDIAGRDFERIEQWIVDGQQEVIEDDEVESPSEPETLVDSGPPNPKTFTPLLAEDINRPNKENSEGYGNLNKTRRATEASGASMSKTMNQPQVNKLIRNGQYGGQSTQPEEHGVSYGQDSTPARLPIQNYSNDLPVIRHSETGESSPEPEKDWTIFSKARVDSRAVEFLGYDYDVAGDSIRIFNFKLEDRTRLENLSRQYRAQRAQVADSVARMRQRAERSMQRAQERQSDPRIQSDVDLNRQPPDFVREGIQDSLRMPTPRKPPLPGTLGETLDVPQAKASTPGAKPSSIQGAATITRQLSIEHLRQLVAGYRPGNMQVLGGATHANTIAPGAKMKFTMQAILPTTFMNHLGKGVASFEMDRLGGAAYLCSVNDSAPWAILVQLIARVLGEPEARVRLWVIKKDKDRKCLMPLYPIPNRYLENGVRPDQLQANDDGKKALRVWVELGDSFPEYQYRDECEFEFKCGGSSVYGPRSRMLLLIKIYVPDLGGYCGAGHSYIDRYKPLEECAVGHIAPVLGVSGFAMQRAVSDGKVSFYAEDTGGRVPLDPKKPVTESYNWGDFSETLVDIILVKFQQPLTTLEDGPRTFAEMGIEDSGNGKDCNLM